MESDCFLSWYDTEKLDLVYIDIKFLSLDGRYNVELLEKVKEMAEGIEVEDAPVFKTRDEIMKKQQVYL